MRGALHVDPRAGAWQPGSDAVGYALEKGEQGSTAELFPPLLAAGLRVLIYNGIYVRVSRAQSRRCVSAVRAQCACRVNE